MMSKKPLILLLILMFVLIGILVYLMQSGEPEIGPALVDIEDPTLNTKVIEKAGQIILPKRQRQVYSGGTLLKRQWVKRMRVKRRFQRDLCGQNSYLIRCLTPYKSPITRLVSPFTRRDCLDAINDIVSKEANSGGQRGQLEGAFFADDLPHKIKAGLEMDVMADRLGLKISQILLPKLAQRGGRHRKTPYCDALMHRAFEVDGN
jgi:hypothetical protein